MFIGGGTVKTDVISPEELVPPAVHTAMTVVGVASAVILAGPVVAVAGLGLGIGGGMLGGFVGGKVFGEGTDGQKWSALGGSVIGGLLGGKLGSGLANGVFPRPVTPGMGFVKGGLPGMKTANAAGAADASAAALLKVTKEAHAIYAKEIPLATRLTQEIAGPDAIVSARAKEPGSAANRLQRALDNKWTSEISTTDSAIDNL
ncbi:hypothetical protein [Massilia antarctica]|uniref:hypothetical protein n=1 Tax=Massilia antarctica TaxID=2765360 RepID=UPI0035EA0239